MFNKSKDFKRMLAMVAVFALSLSMVGCGKKDSDFGEATINNEIQSELSAEDKEDIEEIRNELNGDYANDESSEPEEFTMEDFPCDPKVLNGKWSDCYYQVADVVLQEYHNVPIMDVISALKESKLKFKPFKSCSDTETEFDFEEEFPYNKDEINIYLQSDYHSNITIRCGINKDEHKDEIIKIKDAYFTCIESISPDVPAYITKGFCKDIMTSYATQGSEYVSDYSYRDLDKIIDDDMIDQEWERGHARIGCMAGSMLYDELEEKGNMYYSYDESERYSPLVMAYIIPSGIAGRTDAVRARVYHFIIGENNRLVINKIYTD